MRHMGGVVVSSIRMEMTEVFGAQRLECFNLDDIR